MSDENQEFDKFLKVKPDVLQTLLLFKMYKSLKRMEQGQNKLRAFNTFKGPMTRPFKRDLQYQYATIAAGSSGRVYYLNNPQPDILMGIIVQVGNNWFVDTYYEWFVDYLPKRVEYQIGEIHNPKHFERGIPFETQVEWIAFNNSDESHVYEILTDGYFIPKTVYNQIVGKDGKVPIFGGE